MKLRLPMLASALALVTMMAITPTAFAASNARSTASTTVSGTGVNTVTGAAGTFTGTLNNIVVNDVNGVLTASGYLTGTLTNASGQTIGSVTNLLVSLTATPSGGTCSILNLTLGPLDLNLLGLMVHLDTVHLTITAQQGAGNLLGNLLCAVANLLNNNGPLQGIAGLLSNLLAHL